MSNYQAIYPFYFPAFRVIPKLSGQRQSQHLASTLFPFMYFGKPVVKYCIIDNNTIHLSLFLEAMNKVITYMISKRNLPVALLILAAGVFAGFRTLDLVLNPLH
jgi:hypothetical protein